MVIRPAPSCPEREVKEEGIFLIYNAKERRER